MNSTGKKSRRALTACWIMALLFLSLPFSATREAFAEHVQRNPIVIEEANHVMTPVPFRDMAPVPWRNQRKVVPLRYRPFSPEVRGGLDAVMQKVILPPVGTINILNFEGINDAQGGGFVPPDTNASVGGTQVVETVNVAYAVYDKTTGKLKFGPINIQTLYTPLGGQCGTGNLSDPVVNYDKAAARWVISMVAYNNDFSQNDICVAVSTGSDATGTYNLYDFSYGSVLPDYPKLAAWPDAYYLTSNSFPGGGFHRCRDVCF